MALADPRPKQAALKGLSFCFLQNLPARQNHLSCMQTKFLGPAGGGGGVGGQICTFEQAAKVNIRLIAVALACDLQPIMR